LVTGQPKLLAPRAEILCDTRGKDHAILAELRIGRRVAAGHYGNRLAIVLTTPTMPYTPKEGEYQYACKE
jgi:hypothetical protein